jgi:methyl-accepting chemotaxis protein
MSWFKNLKLAGKLGVGFGLAILCTAIIGFSGLSGINTMDEAADNLVNTALPRALALGQIDTYMRDARTHTMRTTMSTDQATIQKFVDELHVDHELLEGAMADYEANLVSQESEEQFAELKQAIVTQENYQDQIAALALQGKREEARALLDGKSLDQFRSEVKAQSEEISKYNQGREETLSADLDNQKASTLMLMYGVFAAAVVLCIGAALIITRGITKPVAQLAEKMNSLNSICITNLGKGLQGLENGDLTYKVVPETTDAEYQSKDEIGMLSSVFNDMLHKAQAGIAAYEGARKGLTEIVQSIGNASTSVDRSSGELNESSSQVNESAQSIAKTMEEIGSAQEEAARSSTRLSEGSEKLASSAQEASSAMQELQEAIKLVNEGSKDQFEASKKAANVANEGGEAVQQTISSMQRVQSQVGLSSEAVKELGAKQQQIGAIVETIDEIAEQTNLLALNAAIEAARAGDHGRGFAVVADEVRKLAERSGEATKEIAELIDSVREGVEGAIKSMESSASEVESGVEHSGSASAALEEILASINQVQEAAESASTLVEQMAGNAGTVNESIQTVASISQETAASSEELSATGEEVSASTEEVSAAVQQQTAQIEQTSAMAEALSATASELNEVVARFKVDASTTLSVSDSDSKAA